MSQTTNERSQSESEAETDNEGERSLFETVEPTVYPDEGQITEVVVPRSRFTDGDGTLDNVFEAASQENADQYIDTDAFDSATGFNILAFALRDEDETPQLTLLYTVADRESPGEMTIEYEYVGGNHSHQRVIVPDTKTGRGIFLQMTEVNGIEEAAIIDPITSVPGFDLDAHNTWLMNCSQRERQLRLLDLAESDSGSGDGDTNTDLNSDLVSHYLDMGQWRELGLSSAGKEIARNIATETEPRPWLCYRTAVGAIKYAIRDEAQRNGGVEINIPTDEDGIYHPEMGVTAINAGMWPFAADEETLQLNGHRIQYAEGLALPRQAGRVIQHAWIEIDGAVADLTWPWHSPDPISPDTFDPNSEMDSESPPTGLAAPMADAGASGQGPAVYFGTVIPWPKVIATTERRGGHSPILGDETTMSASINDPESEKERRVREHKTR